MRCAKGHYDPCGGHITMMEGPMTSLTPLQQQQLVHARVFSSILLRQMSLMTFL